MKVMKVIRKYDKIGLALTSVSVTISEMLGVMELRLIHLSPDKNKMARRETNSILMSLFIDS